MLPELEIGGSKSFLTYKYQTISFVITLFLGMRSSLKSYYLFFSLLVMQHLYSQVLKTTNHHVWISYAGIHPISNKLSLQVELSIRRNQYLKNPQQLLFRTGVVKDLGGGISIAGGYCFAKTYPYGSFASKATFPENRFWEQVQLRKKIKKLEFVSRVRVEQRFVYQPVLVNTGYEPGPAVYSTRFRIMQRISLPFFGAVIKERTLYATMFDELFFGFGNQIATHHFDQNRAFVGIGYVLPKFGRVEMGYLHQQIHKSAGSKIENNQTVQISFLPNFSIGKIN